MTSVNGIRFVQGLLAALVVAIALAVPAPASAQLLSPEEVSQLAAKALDAVDNFDEAIGIAKPWLEALDPKLLKRYQDRATSARTFVQAKDRYGSSAYGLVALLVTLDDLSLGTSNATTQMLAGTLNKGGSPDRVVMAAMARMSGAGEVCRSAADAVLEVVLRVVRAEEDLLDKLLTEKSAAQK